MPIPNWPTGIVLTYLKPGGVLRLAVPDGLNPSAEYIEHVRPGVRGPGASDHKILYTFKVMKERLERAGFSGEPPGILGSSRGSFTIRTGRTRGDISDDREDMIQEIRMENLVTPP